MTRFSLICALLALAGCSATTHRSSTLPAKPTWQTDAQACTWQWREGGSLGLWVESCRFNGKQWEIAFDAKRAAFVTRRDNEILGVAVRSFAIPAGADITALSQTLITQGELKADAPCVWRNIALRPAPRTTAFHILTPSDPAALGPAPQGEVPDPVCGAYGASTHGVRYFMTDLRWPTRAIFVEEGQERPLFDPASITTLN